MTETLGIILGVIVAYLIGSIPFGYLMGRLGGIDIRRWGSRNVGATNVARVLGIRRGAVVLVLDVLKGAAAAGLVGRGFAGPFDIAEGHRALLLVLCGAAAILGHTFPCWLRFKGGKGVATALGVWLVLSPVATLIALAVWGLLVAIWRYVSLGSIVAAAVLPGALFSLHYSHLRAVLPQLVFAGLLAALVIVRHRSNIVRLARGTENKIGRISVKATRAPKPTDS